MSRRSTPGVTLAPETSRVSAVPAVIGGLSSVYMMIRLLPGSFPEGRCVDHGNAQLFRFGALAACGGAGDDQRGLPADAAAGARAQSFGQGLACSRGLRRRRSVPPINCGVPRDHTVDIGRSVWYFRVALSACVQLWACGGILFTSRRPT